MPERDEAEKVDCAKESECHPEVNAELEAALMKAQENWDLFLRARADLDNYKRRVERDFEANLRRGKKELLMRILDVRDNFERALATPNASVDSLRSGLEIISRQIDSILNLEGVEPIEAVGKPFDPSLHEAVASWDCADVTEPTCSDEIQKGFTYCGDVIRASRVRVARPVE